MKIVTLIIVWCAVVFFSMLLLYRFIPAETQYSVAEHFNVYGDERIMDFVLYAFTGISLLIATAITFIIAIVTRKYFQPDAN